MGICFGMEDTEPDEIKTIAIQAFADSLNFVLNFLQKDVKKKNPVESNRNIESFQ